MQPNLIERFNFADGDFCRWRWRGGLYSTPRSLGHSGKLSCRSRGRYRLRASRRGPLLPHDGRNASGAAAGAIASGTLKLALFIFGVTGYAVMSSAGNGGNIVMPVGVAGNQVFSRPSGKMAGMRSERPRSLRHPVDLEPVRAVLLRGLHGEPSERGRHQHRRRVHSVATTGDRWPGLVGSKSITK
jgi:hypothetical protein